MADGVKFCGVCGGKLPELPPEDNLAQTDKVFCVYCGNCVDSNSEFCEKCGKKRADLQTSANAVNITPMPDMQMPAQPVVLPKALQYMPGMPVMSSAVRTRRNVTIALNVIAIILMFTPVYCGNNGNLFGIFDIMGLNNLSFMFTDEMRTGLTAAGWLYFGPVGFCIFSVIYYAIRFTKPYRLNKDNQYVLDHACLTSGPLFLYIIFSFLILEMLAGSDLSFAFSKPVSISPLMTMIYVLTLANLLLNLIVVQREQ